MSDNDMLAKKEMTSKELNDLVMEYLKNGGKITTCPPGSALYSSVFLDDGMGVKPVKRVVKKKDK